MPEQKDTTKPTILIIEDDEDIGFLLSSMLSREGFEVTVAADGRQALEIIDEIPPPKLVLTDVMLPFADGVQLTTYIRKKPDWRNVPIIMLTSKSQKHDIVRGLNVGANDYVLKPFQPKELMARLRRFLLSTK